jgi:hypothetical protein
MKVKTVWAYKRIKKIRNAYIISVGKSHEKRPSGSLRIWYGDIKTDHGGTVRHRMDDLALEIVANDEFWY